VRRFDNKTVLITGTGGGQGRLAALRFAQEGARVFGCDVNEDGNRETQAMVAEAGGKMVASQPVDLGDPEMARRWIDQSAEEAGGIDVLYNNASACRFVPFEAMPVDDWRWSMRNELDLVFYAIRFAWPYLQRKGGVVINIASVAGMAGSGPGGAAHAAAKGAVIALTKQLAAEGAPFGIRVVAISPGVIDTPGTADLMYDPDARAALLGRNLVQRIGIPEDIIPLAMLLASDEGAYVTGSNFVVDGGRLAH
jgi:NAD(P)-dependent dehydrogenase (short-subunit alcohol dehydrogenase family)